MATRKSIPLKERLLRRREITQSGCWEWTGCRTNSGYGMTNTEEDRKKTIGTHRASYQIFIGSIPDGVCVLHKCDNRGCFNPDHLFLGSHADNTADMISKNRCPIGEAHHNSRLKDWEIKEIRNAHISATRKGPSGGSNTKELAKKYGISEGYILAIVAKKWRVTA